MSRPSYFDMVKAISDAGIVVQRGPRGEVNGIGTYGNMTDLSAQEKTSFVRSVYNSIKENEPVRISKATGKPVREYHYRTEESQRRHLQAEEKKLTKEYKRPVSELRPVSVKRISKSGKVYYTKVMAYDVDIERQYRSTQRAYNRAAREYESLVSQMDELDKAGKKSSKEYKALEKELDKRPEVIGRMRMSTFKLYAENESPERLQEYLNSMALHAQGRVPMNEARDLMGALRGYQHEIILSSSLYKEPISPDVLERYNEATRNFFSRNAASVPWEQKQLIKRYRYRRKNHGEDNQALTDEEVETMTALLNSDDPLHDRELMERLDLTDIDYSR